MTTSALVLPPALNNPNQKKAAPKPQQKAVLPPTARQLMEAIKSFVKRSGLSSDFVEAMYVFASGSVHTAWSAVDFAVAAERSFQGNRKLKGDRADYVGDLNKWLGQNRKADLDSSDEDKEVHNLLLRGLPQGRALKLSPTEIAVLTSWSVNGFRAPKQSPLHTVDLPKLIGSNLRLALWVEQNANSSDRLDRFNAEMKASKWGLLETAQEIFDAETETLQGLVNAEESRREEARAEKEAAAAAEIESVPAAEEPSEGADANETDEVEAAAS
ncbi:MAG: hypothetical protein HQ488_00500 [Parcubacteria group bacterium]|nr:hypothetical protein [Parcubacteria group bacterium]